MATSAQDTERLDDAEWVCTWHTGPDAGAAQAMGVGRHLLGRAHTAELRSDDPCLQPHHVLVEVPPTGEVTVTQLTGRAPILVNGVPVEGATQTTDGALVEVGNSVVSFTRRAAAERAGAPAHILDGALIRGPRAVPGWEQNSPAPPSPPAEHRESSAGLVPALLGLAGAGAIAVVMQQPMFLLFGALGGLVAVGSWAAQRLAAARRRRRDLAAYTDARAAYLTAVRRDRERFRAFHLATVPTVATAQRAIIRRSQELWTRRASHRDAYLAAIGLSDLQWPDDDAGPHETGMPDTDLAAHDLPTPVDLGPGSRLAIRGYHALSIARSLMLQLAASCGPADLRMVIVTDRPAEWDCLRGLPHLAQPDGSAAVVGEAALGPLLADLGEHAAHLVLVTDLPGGLAARTSPLRRALADPATRALLVVLPSEVGVPHLCTSVLTVASGPVGRWVADTRATMLPVPVRFAGIGARSACACTAALRTLVDPEDPLSVATGVPRELSLGTLLGDAGNPLTPAGIVATWVAAGPDPSPCTLIGMAADGTVDIDLVRDGPHGLIAGTTGAGKSELLRSLVAGMAAGASPAHLSFVLVDYKGGATFDACAALPHVVGVITDLDDQMADRALRSLHAELRRREGILREHGAADLAMLRSEAPQVVLPRLVVVIDEFAALVAEQPAFLHALVGVAQRGRSLGVHLLLATQRPNGVISDDIRANTNLRVALRLQDTADALDVVGVTTPAMLPRGLPGRAVMRLGADDHLTFQTARCTVATHTAGETDLQLLVRSIGEAARLCGVPRPLAPWQPPLASAVMRSGLPDGAVGLLDDPDRQQVLPLHWSPADGHLLIAGSPGAGVTSTLHTLAVQTLTGRDRPEAALDVYVLDGRGDELLAGLAAHPRCGAVVRLHERERLMRLVYRLRQIVRSRLTGDTCTGVVLFIDGLDAVRRTLDDVDTAAEYDALEEVLVDGEAAGITIVASVEHAAAIPAGFLARCAHRWVMHLHDVHDASMLGVAATRVPKAAVPGRLVIAGSGLLAQLVFPGDASPVAVPSDCDAPAPAITIVPSAVDAARLSDGSTRDGLTVLPVGIDFGSGDTRHLQLPDGEHVLVLGGARSGRSTALIRLALAWRAVHPDGWVGAVLPRRASAAGRVAHAVAADVSLLDQLPPGRSVLLVIDDAEAVDDPGGKLAALAASGRSGLWIVAGGRPDALRQMYGHWTTVLRRSRTGLVLTGGSDLDGDLLGVVLPRRSPVPSRPGLGWLVAGGPAHLVQVAVDTAEPATGATSRALARQLP